MAPRPLPLIAAAVVLTTACAGASSEPAPPIATAGTAPVTADAVVPGEGEVPSVVVVHPVLQTTVGSCEDFGVGARLEGRRCHTVGAPLALGDTIGGPVGDWIADAVAVDDPAAGWSTEVTFADGSVDATRAAFEAAEAEGVDRFLVVADGRGLLEFGFQDIAADGTAVLGPGLSEREAEVLADVLAGRPWPDLDRRGPQAGDVWTVAIAAHVCGVWVAPPPAIDPPGALAVAADGVIEIRPTADDDVDGAVTLGDLLTAAGWTASDDRLQLWGDVDVRTGDTCPDGREGTVRWSVDGDDRPGDPTTARLGHRQVVVLSFDPADQVPVDDPPAVAALPIPQLSGG